MEDKQQKQESRRIQATLEGKAIEVFDDLASLLPIGDTAIIRMLVLEYGPAKIAELKKKSCPSCIEDMK